MLSDSQNASNGGQNDTAVEPETQNLGKTIKDKGGRRFWSERRQSRDTAFSPDRRTGPERRCGVDRRHGRDRRSPEGFRRILGADRRLAYNNHHLMNILWS